jgi:hypothetical protein
MGLAGLVLSCFQAESNKRRVSKHGQPSYGMAVYRVARYGRKVQLKHTTAA